MVEKEELQELKVADLRALLQSDGLKVSGKKSELIDRILANSGPASGGRATRSRSKSRSRSKPRSRSKSQARSKSRTRKAAAPEAKKKTSNPKKKSGAGSSKSKSLGFNPLLVPVLAIAAAAGNSVYLALTSPPPADFGSGSMFDKIAGRYDLINRALALNMDRAWRREMVAAVSSDGDLFAGGGKGVRVLDLATGTADVAILIAETANGEDGTTGASVLGVDPSENMISVGNGKLEAAGLDDTVSLQVGDARGLDGLSDDSFQAATMAFGIRNIPEKEEALCEIWRVLDKGAGGSKLAILEFSEPGPDAGILGHVARFFIRNVVPILGAVLSGAPTEYLHLQNSIKDFPAPEKFGELMEGLKCKQILTPPKRAGEEVAPKPKKGRGAFKLEEIRQMNFGSVQLYLATPFVKFT